MMSPFRFVIPARLLPYWASARKKKIQFQSDLHHMRLSVSADLQAAMFWLTQLLSRCHGYVTVASSGPLWSKGKSAKHAITWSLAFEWYKKNVFLPYHLTYFFSSKPTSSAMCSPWGRWVNVLAPTEPCTSIIVFVSDTAQHAVQPPGLSLSFRVFA